MTGTVVSTAFEVTVPDEHILTLLEMAGFGIAYWAESLEVDEEARTVTIVLDAEGREDPALPKVRVLKFEWIAKRLVQLGTSSPLIRDIIEPGSMVAGYAQRYMAELIRGEDDDGAIDADLADAIIQIVYFGDIIFS